MSKTVEELRAEWDKLNRRGTVAEPTTSAAKSEDDTERARIRAIFDKVLGRTRA